MVKGTAAPGIGQKSLPEAFFSGNLANLALDLRNGFTGPCINDYEAEEGLRGIVDILGRPNRARARHHRLIRLGGPGREGFGRLQGAGRRLPNR